MVLYTLLVVIQCQEYDRICVGNPETKKEPSM